MNEAALTIRLNSPERRGNAVRFSWDVEPATEFYRSTEFTLEFPASVDASIVPDEVWLRVMLVCLHPHWTLLRPCRVVLPRRLPAGEREFWMRLCDSAAAALEVDRSSDESFSSRIARGVEIVESGPPIGPLPPATDEGFVALCFSGGRDSLTQLGLLQELGERPLLVTTNAPRRDGDEFSKPRRRQVIEEAAGRRGAELIEVESDFRVCWNELDPRASIYGVSPNEVTDTLLYFAVAWATAVARGARGVFLASEAEVQETMRRDGAIVQHPHFMYSAATQAALRALLEPSGVGYCGLTYPLLQFQIQRLLVQRYAELRDLQYSCWQQRQGEDVCSRCRECFTIAVNLISSGVAPAEIGIDLDQLLRAQRDWRPGGSPENPRGTIGSRAGRYGDDQVVRSFRSFELDEVRTLAGDAGLSTDAVAAFEQLRATALTAGDPEPEPGFRAEYLELIDSRLRDGLAAILGEHFDPEPPERHRELFARTRLLSDWIAAPLASEPRRPVVSRHESSARPRPPAPVEPRTDQLAEIADCIPGPEPELASANGHRVLPVADVDLGGNESAYVAEAVETGWVSSTGPYVERLEAAFAEYCGTRYAITTASGATALELMLRAGGVGPGDEVIVPSFTMVATANAVHHVGAKVVFVDTDLATWNMDLERTAEAIGPRTRAIVAMHTYGHPVDMDALRTLADANSLALFEDAAEAHGATCRGRRVGSLSDAAAFSFYGNKIMTTGEGGIVTTDSHELAAAARDLRGHAFSSDRHFWHRRRAFNFRMSNLQAALGLAQLERLDEFLEKRRRLAAMYREHIAPVPGIVVPPLEDGFESANWMFGILVDDDFGCSRDELRRLLAADGIETRAFFAPLHIQPAYLEEFEGARLHGAETLGRTGLYLPSALWITEDDVARIAARIAQAAGAGAGDEEGLGSQPSPA